MTVERIKTAGLAERWDVDKQAIRKMVEMGLPVTKVNRRLWLFEIKKADEWLNKLNK